MLFGPVLPGHVILRLAQSGTQLGIAWHGQKIANLARHSGVGNIVFVNVVAAGAENDQNEKPEPDGQMVGISVMYPRAHSVF